MSGPSQRPDSRPTAPSRRWTDAALTSARRLFHRLAGVRRLYYPVAGVRRLYHPVAGVRRLYHWVGLSAEPRPVRRLSVAYLVLGALVVVAGLARAESVPTGWLAAAVAAVVLAQLARLTVRIGSGRPTIAWGEAAVIVVLYAVPAAWVPAVVGTGVLLRELLRAGFGPRQPAAFLFRAAALLALAAAAAAGVAGMVAPVYRADLTPGVALALTSGAMAYTVVGAALLAATLTAHGNSSFWTALSSVVRSKLLMVVGNVLVGLLVVLLIDLGQPLWLLILSPGLWLLQQTYAHRLRVEDERRFWQSFAAAARALNQLDECGVVRACMSGARELFTPNETELLLVREGGARRSLLANARGELTIGDALSTRDYNGYEASRRLIVGQVHVGDLYLRYAQPIALDGRRQSAFSAFSDALAAALHDAATVRELQEISERSSREAAQDPLTGLANRGTLLQRGDDLLRKLHRDAPAGLLLLDLDRFREVNDTLGHAAGDQLLRTTAERLSALVQPGDLLARLGGDEFALLLTALPEDVPGPVGDRIPAVRQARRRARQVLETLAAPTEVCGVSLSVEASIGVAVAPAGSIDMTELLRRADIAMYEAKRGGERVCRYEGSRDDGSADRLALLAELREALNVSDQLVLVMQPAVDLTSGLATGVEALVRWRHPRRGPLGPVEFIRTVEDSELLRPFSLYVIDKALDVASGWAAHDLDVPVSVNISPRSLLDRRLPVDVAELLRRHRVPPRRLVLEITETVVLSESAVIDEVLAELREVGVQLAVDDFGTGCSSLTFLTRITVDELKVDRTFVAKMFDSPEEAAIVRTTVDLGRELGLRVVAEGVETAQQRAALAELGCTAAQGFHFFAPMPAEKIGVVLRALRAGAGAGGRVIPLRADGAS